MRILTLRGLAVAGVAVIVATSAATLAIAGGGGGANGGATVQDLPVGGAQPNGGSTLCTAAVNSTGTLAGGFRVASTAAFGPGNYEVIFRAPCTNITAARGWMHFVQAHTLTTGTIAPGTSCTAADRAGNPNGVFVQCSDSTGTPAATSFMLQVSR
jgi:hypothetical protein